MPGRPEITLLRPLLGVGREANERYCHDHGLRPRADETNADQGYTRNRLRHEQMPLLEAANPGLRERLGQAASLAAADYALLAGLEERAWEQVHRASRTERIELDRAAWASLPVGLQRATLRRAAQALRPGLRDLGFRAVELAREVALGQGSGRQVSLPAGLRLETLAGRLRIWAGEPPADDGPLLPEGTELVLPIPGQVELAGGWLLTAVEGEGMGYRPPPADPWRVAVDVGEVTELTVRPRRPGERFRPLGMGGHTALVSDVMIDRKLPAASRGRWAIVALPEHLVWLVGHRLDERVRVRADTAQSVTLIAVPPPVDAG
jgi:tRNA(Ile)-lysidine synthase